MNVVIMVWHEVPESYNLSSQAMHKTVKQSLNNIKEKAEEDAPSSIWLPAFKMVSQNELAQDFLGFQVSAEGKQVSSCTQTADIEMYALPESDGTM